MSKEKRKAARGQVSATVVLLQDERPIGSFRVLNLSVGGALLVGHAPQLRPGNLEVLVRLSTGKTVRAGANVVREESVDDSSVFAIEFTAMTVDDREAIDNLVLTAIDDESDPTALVVARTSERRSLLRRQLKGLSYPSFAVSSLEDALGFLKAPNAVTVALVDLSLEDGQAMAILKYLAERHPTVRRIALSTAAGMTPALGVPTTAPLAHDVVRNPWSRESLAQALED